MALAMKGAQLVKQANFAPAAIQHFNYSSEVLMHQYSRENVTYHIFSDGEFLLASLKTFLQVRRPRAMNTAAMKRGRGGRFSTWIVVIFIANIKCKQALIKFALTGLFIQNINC